MDNISQVLDNKMCCGCGACYSICKADCIKFINGKDINYPEIDLDKCYKCGMCLEVCPGKLRIDRLIYNKKIDIESNIADIKVSYSIDDEIRINSASGGIITQIIKNLLEKGDIDGAIVVIQDSSDIIMNKAIIINSVKELIKSQGSRYSPSSNCIPLKEVIKNEKYKRLVFVGKPCEIEALGKLELKDRNLKDKIKMKICIMCHHTPTRNGVKALLESQNINLDKVKEIKFRGNGWPGNFEVRDTKEKIFSTSYFNAWNNYISKYCNEACNYCENPFPLEADIIVGDPWGEEYEKDNKGRSLLIIRSKYGQKVIKDMEKSNIIISEKKVYEDVKRYQKYLLNRFEDFYLLSLVFKKVHGYSISFKEYIQLFKDRPLNLLRYFKRVNGFKMNYRKWIYK